MHKKQYVLAALLAAVAVGACGSTSSTTSSRAAASSNAAPPIVASGSTARMATYQTATGENYFALSLAATLPTTQKPTDLVVLFDTSASQAGAYREDALTALKTML